MCSKTCFTVGGRILSKEIYLREVRLWEVGQIFIGHFIEGLWMWLCTSPASQSDQANVKVTAGDSKVTRA